MGFCHPARNVTCAKSSEAVVGIAGSWVDVGVPEIVHALGLEWSELLVAGTG